MKSANFLTTIFPVIVQGRISLLVKNDDLGGVNRIAGRAVGAVHHEKAERKGVVLGGGFIQIALPRKGDIDIAAAAGERRKAKVYGVAAGGVCWLKLVQPVADRPKKAVADGAAACEFKSGPHGVVWKHGGGNRQQL